eukprot:TRINITY_DN496_c0_g1_i3.p2 TRINITY_DN496_c0_g1~~TRINITY_DN496_c0_g1_i3.p2  ORF type:complete len:109 (+),score=35.17 TRINITY_DN496_c0_g1_i3:246-572(+)
MICSEVAIIASKRLRNKIAGFATHLMRRIEKGQSVRGISLKLQEEERERKDNYVPEKSSVDTESMEVDNETLAMLKHMNMGSLKGLTGPSGNTNERENRGNRGGRRNN